jgi:hypothetical protein
MSEIVSLDQLHALSDADFVKMSAAIEAEVARQKCERLAARKREYEQKLADLKLAFSDVADSYVTGDGGITSQAPLQDVDARAKQQTPPIADRTSTRRVDWAQQQDTDAKIAEAPLPDALAFDRNLATYFAFDLKINFKRTGREISWINRGLEVRFGSKIEAWVWMGELQPKMWGGASQLDRQPCIARFPQQTHLAKAKNILVDFFQGRGSVGFGLPEGIYWAMDSLVAARAWEPCIAECSPRMYSIERQQNPSLAPCMIARRIAGEALALSSVSDTNLSPHLKRLLEEPWGVDDKWDRLEGTFGARGTPRPPNKKAKMAALKDKM